MELEAQDENIKEKFNSDIKVIEEDLNTHFLNPLKKGSFPSTSSRLYMVINNFVFKYGKDDKKSSLSYDYYKSIIKDSIAEFQNQLNYESDNNQFVDFFIDITNRIELIIWFLKNSFSFLDYYFTKEKGLSNLEKLGRDLYKEDIFMPFQKKITLEVNNLLKEYRDGNENNGTKIKKILDTMKGMDLPKPKIKIENNSFFWINEINEDYSTPIQDYWYDYFKQDIEELVTKKATNDIINRSTPEYVLFELEFITKEHEIQKEFINNIYHEKLNSIIYKEIIGKNMIELIEMETGVKNMLENGKKDELSKLYDLFKFYQPSVDKLSEKFKSYIIKRGEDFQKDEKKFRDPILFVPELIEFKKEMKTLIEECFKKNKTMQDAEFEGFSAFMKRDYYSKILALYVDYCMRSFFKGKSEDEINSILDNIILLYKYLNSKLYFQTETEQLMSKRLIKDLSLSYNEKIFITKLKQESSLSDITKMTTMIDDLEKNNVEIENYKNSPSKGAPNGINFRVKIINFSAWNFDKKHILKIDLPRLFSSCIADLERYYKNRYSDRKLIWYLDFSKVEIKYLYLINQNISVSTLPQILILLELEKSEPLSIKKLSEILGISKDLIKDNIKGLIYNKSFNPNSLYDKGVIISINNKTENFKDEDEFKINKNFTSSSFKFNTLPMPKKKTDEEKKKKEEFTEAQNKIKENNIIRTTLVRIMKSRIGQETTHDWLINETAKQINSFTAQPTQIKENIEKLIEDNFIKRVENKRGCYEYVA